MFLLCGKERISFWCTEIGCWQTNLPLYKAESFVPNLLIIRDQIPRCKRRQTYQNIRLLGIYQGCLNDFMINIFEFKAIETSNVSVQVG